MLTLLCPCISVLKKSRRRGRGWARALGPEQLLRVCEAITSGKGVCPLEGDVADYGGGPRSIVVLLTFLEVNSSIMDTGKKSRGGMED